ncbi:MAG: P1 family peptidase [Hyphomicrobiaceae bacterium]|nr:P1 family peptidase [Hyphomicrobiaceae bacterium]
MTHCRNLITDVPGIAVGNAQDALVYSGVSVVLPNRAAVAAVDVRGGGPGTRETDAIGLSGTVEEIHAIVLSGGSAFGLAAASGVQSYLAAQGIGFAVGEARIPIVPQAILFDLLNGGDKTAAGAAIYERLAAEACLRAGPNFELGSIGAGFGATTATLRGGLGSASQVLDDGLVVGALVAVNAAGSVTMGSSRHFWASPFEQNAEFGGSGLPVGPMDETTSIRLKRLAGASTTIAVIATNGRLTKPQAHRLAVMAQTGMARAIYPVHTPLDGDVVFALATGDAPLADSVIALAELGAHAANVLARAIARGVYAAAPCPQGWTGPPGYATKFGGRS